MKLLFLLNQISADLPKLKKTNFSLKRCQVRENEFHVLRYCMQFRYTFLSGNSVRVVSILSCYTF